MMALVLIRGSRSFFFCFSTMAGSNANRGTIGTGAIRAAAANADHMLASLAIDRLLLAASIGLPGR